MAYYANEVTFDIKSGKLLFRDADFYDGVIAMAKKGREQQAQVAQGQLDQMKHDQEIRDQQLGKAEPFLTSLESTKPGSLSPFSQSQLDSDLRNINDTYGGLRKTGLKSIAQRGFGNAPTGMEASVINTGNENQGKEETGAYENALQKTYGEQLEAMKARMGLQSIYDPTKPAGVASDAAYRQSQMGSTLGDISAGLGSAAGLASSSIGMAGKV